MFENENSPAIKIGSALIDENCYLKIADESVYRFLGEFSIFPITKNIHPDYLEKFKQKISSLPLDKEDFIILKLRYTANIPRSTDSDENYVISENQYVPVVIFMKKGFAKVKNYSFINIEIHHIIYLKECANNLNRIVKRYTSLLSLYDDLCFEYKTSDESFVLFRFKGDSEKFEYKGSLSDWQEKLKSENSITPKNRASFAKLFSDIKSCSSSFFCVIKTNILSNGDDFEDVHIKGFTIAESPSEKIVLGTIKTSGSYSAADLDFFRNQADLDSLTGLLNKKAVTNAILTRLKSEVAKSTSLIMMDVDYFKDINDNYGHMFGDEVLKTVANILKNVIGDRGIIGRFGGDEFLITVENVDDETELRAILKSIRSQIEWAYSGQIKISTSLGVATYPKDADNYETLLKIADKCLYIAKEKGRNRFIIYRKEQHGTLSYVDLNSKAISMIPKVSIAQKSDHICQIIKTLSHSNNDEDRIKNVADSLKDYYSFDKCMIFYGSELAPVYSYNATDEDLKITSLLDGYKDIFDNRNILSIGNYISVEAKNRELYNFLFATKNYSAIQYLITDEENNIKGLIFISTCNHTNKWSEVDTNYLTIIFKLISEALNEQ